MSVIRSSRVEYKYINGALFCVVVGLVYFFLTISMIDVAAAGQVFFTGLNGRAMFNYPIDQNFIGIGIASFIPAYLVHCYEQNKQWIAISVVILANYYVAVYFGVRVKK